MKVRRSDGMGLGGALCACIKTVTVRFRLVRKKIASVRSVRFGRLGSVGSVRFGLVQFDSVGSVGSVRFGSAR